MPPEAPDQRPDSNSEREESTVFRSLPFPSPEVIREFPDRGAQWLFEDPGNVRELLHIVDPETARSLEFERAERINRTFIPADLRKLENDLLFRVPAFADEESIWVYVLLEHQSTVDPWMALRLYLYIGEVWKAQRQEWRSKVTTSDERRIAPVVPLVFYTGEETWPQPIALTQIMDVKIGFERYVPQWDTLFLSLHALQPETLSASALAISQVLRVWQAERQPLEELQRILLDAMHNLEGLSESQSGQWARMVWFFYLLAFHRRDGADYERLFATVNDRVMASHFQEKPNMVSVAKSMAEIIAERSKEEGWQEGWQEGERGALTIVLKARFGEISSDTEVKVKAASPETLDRWLATAATAKTLEEALT